MKENATAINPQNSADRLIAIVDSAFRKDRSKASTEVWASVFGIEEEDAVEKQRLVSDYLSAVGAELLSIESALAAANVPEPLHKASITRIRNAFSVGALNSKWDDHAGRHLEAETRMALRWIAYTLPKESSAASIEDVTSILELLDDLDAQLSNGGLPAGLKVLLEKHAAEMRKAVKLFPVQGVAGLRKVVRTVLADIHLDEDEIRSATQQGDSNKVRAVLGRFGAAFKKTAEITGDLDKISKGTSLVIDVIEAGSQLLSLPAA
ncbi:MAG: hypothetical protein ACD_23C00493G0002 [uncultured bacterium]|jgi:hypothetical protein|nr:MAG: hypothetical protein ACD_23C00493G0002 [uncultured bacterium]